MRDRDYQFLQQKYAVSAFADRGITLIEGSGVYLKDACGDSYLDFMTNYGVNIFGYNHPEVVDRLTHQLRRLATLHGSFNNDQRAMAMHRLVSRCGGGLACVHLASSGSEAVEAALKYAVLATGRKVFVSCRDGYHGKTLGSLSATDNPKYRNEFEPLLWEFKRIEYSQPRQLEEALSEKEAAAFIVEPIQGEAGVILPDPDFLAEAGEICKKKGTLIILDEIQTGTGRTGTFLASADGQVPCDILCLGKGLAGGIPVGAALISKEVAGHIPKHVHTSTFGGNPLACAGINAVLDLLGPHLLEGIQTIGKYFLDGLKSLSSPLIADIRGKGLMVGLEFREKRNDILQNLQREKILAIPAGANVVRFLPPYIIEKEHVDLVIEKLHRVLSQL